MKKFKENYNSKMAFKLVFYEAALVKGAHGAKKFSKTAEQVRKSKEDYWFIQIKQKG